MQNIVSLSLTTYMKYVRPINDEWWQFGYFIYVTKETTNAIRFEINDKRQQKCYHHHE